MSLDPFTLGAGALGAITQKDSNNQQENIAQQQLAQQAGLINRQENLFDTLQNIAKQADAQGYFDPQRRLNLLQNQVDYDRNSALLSEAGAANAMGYRAGDTVPVDQMNQTRGAFDLQLRQLANQIMNQSLANKIAAYSAANPSSLNAAMGTLGDNARFAIGREQSLGGLMASLIPYLQSRQQNNNSGYDQAMNDFFDSMGTKANPNLPSGGPSALGSAPVSAGGSNDGSQPPTSPSLRMRSTSAPLGFNA